MKSTMPALFVAAVLLSCGTDQQQAADVAGVADALPDPRVADAGADDLSHDAGESQGREVGQDVVEPRTTPGGLPLELPFAYERSMTGEPLTPEEVAVWHSRESSMSWEDAQWLTKLQENETTQSTC